MGGQLVERIMMGENGLERFGGLSRAELPSCPHSHTSLPELEDRDMIT